MQFLRDARWLVKTDIQNRDSRVSRLKTCRDSGFREENLGQSLQIGTVGHSARVLGGFGHMLPRKKFNFEVFKLLEMH